MSLIKAATTWRTNGELIADCARLGYLQEDWRTLDPTFGRGGWWTQWGPHELVTHDIRLDRVDFRDLPYPDQTFQQAVFDPPYMAPGGRKTSTIGEMNDRFGMHEAARTPKENQELIDAGITELHRVLRPRGWLLVKCMDYVTGGKLWLGTHHTLTHSLSLGFDCVDRLEHIRSQGPQSQTTQVHARRNLSTLFVLKKGKT